MRWALTTGLGLGHAPNMAQAKKKSKAKRASGPSGQHLVPQRTVRIPDELWERFRLAVEAVETDRNTAINALVERYCTESEK